MVIYKAEFLNGKVYIGKSKSFDDRKIKHYYSTRYYNTKLTNAINKYGFDSINWEILYQTDNLQDLNEKEIEFIKKYNPAYSIRLSEKNFGTADNNVRIVPLYAAFCI